LQQLRTVQHAGNLHFILRLVSRGDRPRAKPTNRLAAPYPTLVGGIFDGRKNNALPAFRNGRGIESYLKA
jgi:hypothetical protein